MQNTPVQGFTYMDSTDPPCNLATAIGLLANQADVKGLSYDTDLASVQTPIMVRVSVSSPGLVTTGAFFDTIEYNNGTPTDLSVYSTGLLLDPGYYLVGSEVQFAAQLTGSFLTIAYSISSTGANGSPSWQEFTFDQTAAIVSSYGGSTLASTYATPYQSMLSSGNLRIPAASTKLACSGWQQQITSSPVIYYAAVWAVQIAQI